MARKGAEQARRSTRQAVGEPKREGAAGGEADEGDGDSAGGRVAHTRIRRVMYQSGHLEAGILRVLPSWPGKTGAATGKPGVAAADQPESPNS